jgi:DNA polymerase
MATDDPLESALVCDVETQSLLELPKVGAHRYAHHPSTRMLVACFGFVNANTDPEAWLPDTPLPAAMRLHLMRGGIIAAWNAAFDVAILNRFLPREIPRITIEQMHDIAAQAASSALPRGLDKCCAAIGLPEAKDRAGQAAMRWFMRPRKWEGGNPVWGEDPKRFTALIAYCQQDVRLERTIMRRLPQLQAIDRPVFELDARINARGMRIDRALIDIGGPALYRAMIEANRRIAELTRDAKSPVPKVTSTNKIVQLLQDHGVALILAEPKTQTADEIVAAAEAAELIRQEREDDGGEDDDEDEANTKKSLRGALAKTSVTAMLERDDLPDLVRQVLELRRDYGRTSTAKLRSLAATLSPSDDRTRDYISFHAASTGRAGGRLIQPQNLPRESYTADEWPVVLRDLASRSVERFVAKHRISPVAAIVKLIRGAIIAAPEHVLCGGDFSKIELCVGAWLAMQEDLLEDLRRGTDTYRQLAAVIYSVPVGAVNELQRQVAKSAMLGCITEGSLVLTDHGLCPIEHVQLHHRVWDGERFVRHDGVVDQGIKEVITHDGLTATPDHIVFLENGQSVPLIEAALGEKRLLRTHTRGLSNRRLGDSGFDVQKSERLPPAALPMRGLRQRELRELGQLDGRSISRLSLQREETPHLQRAVEETDCRCARCGASALPGSEDSELSSLRRSWDRVSVLEHPSGYKLDRSESQLTPGGVGTGPCEQQWPLRARQSPLGYPSDEHSKPAQLSGTVAAAASILRRSGHQDVSQRHPHRGGISSGSRTPCAIEVPNLASTRRLARVYDILNAGPQHRFAVSGVLVHNCIFGLGPEAFQKYVLAVARVAIDLDTAQRIVTTFRGTYSNFPVAWKATGRAAFRAVEQPGSAHGCLGDKVRFRCTANRRWLTATLPSGRRLRYPQPHIVEELNRFGAMADVLKTFGVSQYTHQWAAEHKHGSLLFQNCVSAIARDILTAATTRFETAELPVILHVHDEILAEVPIERGVTHALVHRLMTERPVWAVGLPIDAECWMGARYGKTRKLTRQQIMELEKTNR